MTDRDPERGWGWPQRIETAGVFEVLDAEVDLSGPEPEPSAPKPGKCGARIAPPGRIAVRRWCLWRSRIMTLRGFGNSLPSMVKRWSRNGKLFGSASVFSEAAE
jgi:hypothetical protein